MLKRTSLITLSTSSTFASALLLALGVHTPIYRTLFATMQMVREIRFPERFVLAILTVLAVLGALGLESLLERRGSIKAPVAWYAAASAAAFTAQRSAF